MIRSSLVLATATAAACGGSSPPAQQPATTADTDGSEQPASAQGQPQPTGSEAKPARQADEEPNQSEPEREPVDKLTYQSALQAVLSDYALLEALKLDEPGRAPLQVAGDELPDGLAVYVDQRAIEVVPEPDSPTDEPILILTRVELSSERGKFKYRFPAEGVSGTSRVGSDAGKWILLSSRISQQ